MHHLTILQNVIFPIGGESDGSTGVLKEIKGWCHESFVSVPLNFSQTFSFSPRAYSAMRLRRLTSRSEHHHKHFLESKILLVSPKVKAMKVCKLVPSLKFDLKLQTSAVSWYSRQFSRHHFITINRTGHFYHSIECLCVYTV